MEVVTLRPYAPASFTPGWMPGIHFCYRLKRPQGHSVAGGITLMKNSSDPIGNRTHNLPACRSVTEPIAPSRTPKGLKRNTKRSVITTSDKWALCTSLEEYVGYNAHVMAVIRHPWQATHDGFYGETTQSLIWWAQRGGGGGVTFFGLFYDAASNSNGIVSNCRSIYVWWIINRSEGSDCSGTDVLSQYL
jgi:hypothetical protein